MGKQALLGITIALCITSMSSLASSNIVFTAAHRNGEIVWTHMDGCTNYWVEWAPSVDGPWTNSWARLQSIQPTGTVCSAKVPMFYRVIGQYLPRVAAPVLGPLSSAGGNYFYATVSGPGVVHYRYNGDDVTESDPTETIMFIGGFPQRVIYFEKPYGVYEWWVVARSFSQGMHPSDKVYRFYP